MKYFYRWHGRGFFDRMMDAWRDLARAEAGRGPEPTAALSDSQSVQTTESGGPRGDDGGKQVVGRKRHIAVDVAGSPIVVDVHAASVQDRDGALHKGIFWAGIGGCVWIGGPAPCVAGPGAARAPVSGVVRAERRRGGGRAGGAGRVMRRAGAAGLWRER